MTSTHFTFEDKNMKTQRGRVTCSKTHTIGGRGETRTHKHRGSTADKGKHPAQDLQAAELDSGLDNSKALLALKQGDLLSDFFPHLKYLRCKDF